MADHSKKYREAAKMLDASRRYTVDEAIKVLKSLPKAKFDETVEVAMRLGVDPKQADQIVRGSASLPKGLGKDVRVIAFCTGAVAEKAKAEGAIEVGAEDLAEKIQGGWTDFDIAVTSPDMMRHVGKLGRILGPQGKMPSPKSGTVTDDVAAAVREFRAGRIEYRNDSSGNVHAPVGKMSFPEDDIKMNVEAFIAHITASKPAAVKGTFVIAAYLTSTMSPSLRLAV
jgi:large subunit ribosomal protein L1